MATLTKKELLEAIKDMPMDAPIVSEQNDVECNLCDVWYNVYENKINLVIC